MAGSLAQQPHVAGMQEVEAAVGEADRLARPMPPQSLPRADARSRILAPSGAWCSIRSRWISSRVRERHAELLDFEAAGHVAQRGRLGIVGPAGQAEADDGEHHVAGSGDVVDLPRPRRQQLGAAVGAHQGHAIAVERDEHGLHLEALHELLADPNRVFGPADGHPGGELGLEPVRGHAVHAAIPAVVVRPDRVGEHADARPPAISR